MRPEQVVLVCGTGTEVGKTWVGTQLLHEFRSRGLDVAARKPAQSFEVGADGSPLGGATDAEVLGAASGEPAGGVCPSHRSYHRAMAPPMAAEALGLPAFTIADLVDEVVWPDRPVDFGLVETAGGVRSPQACDGDAIEFARALQPDLVILVADAGLGTINGVRLSIDALLPVVADLRDGTLLEVIPVAVVLDRFEPADEIHRRNLAWLTSDHTLEIFTLPGQESSLGDFILLHRSTPFSRKQP
ncbi:MAG TPA: dethiobiotin synthase [Acidimicrobiales bacterium]|nr:dethiobiotin synthase [Acidimicrobiales bacterium]